MEIKHLFGWLAAGFMVLSFCYPILKRMKFKGKNLHAHCYFGYISIILALIHITQISFSAGFISLISMIIIVISGIIMKHFKNVFLKNILIWKWIHILLAVVCTLGLIVHIAEYIILYIIN